MTPSFRASHAIHENLVKPSAVAHYSVFAAHDNTGNSAERPLVQVNLKFGNKVNGHKGIVHGGVASLLFDDAFGFAYFSATAGPDAKDFLLGFTANLTVNYRAPLRENSEAVLKVWLGESDLGPSERGVFARLPPPLTPPFPQRASKAGRSSSGAGCRARGGRSFTRRRPLCSSSTGA